MEKKKKTDFAEYWEMAILDSIRSTGRLVGLKGRAKDAALFFGILIILALGVLSGWIPDTILQTLKGDAASSFRLALFVLGLVFVELVLVFLVTLFFIAPTKIYTSKKTDANRLTWADIEIEEFTFAEESGLGVGLKITSHKLKEDVIMGMRAEIGNINRAGKPTGRVVSPRLAWAIGKDAIFSLLWDGATVYSEDPRLLLVANSDGKESWIETQDENRQIVLFKLDNNIHYQIAIEMKGELFALGYELVRCTVICDLAYNNIEARFRYKILEIDKHTSGKEILIEGRRG
jgi:hypothetical protein